MPEENRVIAKLDSNDVITGNLVKKDKDFIYLEDAVVTRSDGSITNAFSVCIPSNRIVYLTSQDRITFKLKQNGRQLLRD